jgi:hypothetical protein
MHALAAGAVFMAACTLSPLRLFSAGRSTPQPPIELRRCDDVQDVLCLITFGLEPPDEMLILLLTVPGLPEELALAVTRNDEKISFACVTTAQSPTVVYCTGPQIPLGTTVLIEVFAVEEKVLLASGEFTLTAFALPTVQAGGVELPTPGALLNPQGTRTPLPRGTLFPGTAYPNATPIPPRISPPNSPPISPP